MGVEQRKNRGKNENQTIWKYALTLIDRQVSVFHSVRKLAQF